MCGMIDGIGDAIGGLAGGIGDAVGGVWDGLRNSGLDNILATVGTVVPGPWTPFAVGYNVADNASQGNWLGAGLSGLGGLGALGGAGSAAGGLGDVAASAGDMGGLMDTIGSAGIGLGEAAGEAASFAAPSIMDSVGSVTGGLGGVGEAASGAGGIAGFYGSNPSGGNGGSLSDMFKNAADWTSQNGSLLKGGLRIGGSVLDAFGARGAQSAIGNNLRQLNDMYSAQSPYASEMRRQLARKDAARGRNSQYGTREVQLMNSLTNQKASMMNSPAYLNQLSASSNKTLPYGGIARGLSSLF